MSIIRRGAITDYDGSTKNPAVTTKSIYGLRVGEHVQPYGIASAPLVDKGATVIKGAVGGSDDHLIALVVGSGYRPALADGEVQISGPVEIASKGETGQHLKFLADGSIQIATGSYVTTFTPFGTIETDAEIISERDVKADTISLKDHIHGGVTTGRSETEEPKG